MDDSDKSAHVSRREFYGALFAIWIYITVVIVDLLRIEWRLSTAVLGLFSLSMVFWYSRAGFIAGRASGKT